MAASKLTEEQKAYVVTELACFVPPKTVLAGLYERWEGVDATYHQVAKYDPTRGFGDRKPAAKWIALFEYTRQQYLSELSRYPIADKVFRTAQRQRMFDKAVERGNDVFALQVLQEAAKDLGGLYTNKRIVSGDPLQTLAQMLGISPSELPGGPNRGVDPRVGRHIMITAGKNGGNGDKAAAS